MGMVRHVKPRFLACPQAADLVAFACAASAGIHAGLVPEHLREEPRLGVAFALSVVALLSTGAATAVRPSDPRAARTAALLLASLIAGYAASRTTGIPLLAPNPEAADAVGVMAVSVEVVGLVFALRLGQLGAVSGRVPLEVTRRRRHQDA